SRLPPPPASTLFPYTTLFRSSVLIVALGNVIVLVPMLLNAHPGTRYGIPFPVFARASFGVRGANIAAVARALVACGWFGIQTWIDRKSTRLNSSHVEISYAVF